MRIDSTTTNINQKIGRDWRWQARILGLADGD